MAKIIDPDNLNQGTEVVIDTTAKTIQLIVAGNLSSDGVTLQALYSFLKEEWGSDADLPPFPFPITSITDEQFELVNGWDFKDATTRGLIRDGGWALKNTSGVSQEEYACIVSLGAFDNPAADLAYYQQATGGTPTDILLAGEVNQAVKIYGDATHGNFDYRGYFKLFLREQGKTFDVYDLPTAQNIAALTYKKYGLPLSNTTDVKITASDATIASSAPYTGITVTYYATPQSRTIGSSSYDFSVIIDGNGASKEEIYEKIQYLLRQSTDIDSGAGTVRGDVASPLLRFVGDTLYTEQGVFIDDFDATDTNSIVFTDDSGDEHTFPFVAAGTIYFNENLVADANAKYWMYFTSGYGSASAIIVDDADGVDINGSVSGASSVSFTFDYDGNTQGGRTAGTDAAVTVVAIGLDSAQFVKTTATITRSTTNSISLVSALERNYSNP